MRFHEVIQRLGMELDTPELQPDANGACALEFSSVTVNFFSDAAGGAFNAVSVVGNVDAEDRHVQQQLLAGNLFTEGLGASTLGMDEDGLVALCQRFECGELNFPRFYSSLERFVNTAMHWQRRLGTVPTRAVH